MDQVLDSIKIPFAQLATRKNLDDALTEEQSTAVGKLVKQGYTRDRESRAEWEKRNKESYKLALQVSEHKTFPWEGASNVKFPLLTISTLQFAARAYATLVNGPDIVKCRTVGDDADGEKRQRANRVSQHMSYQLLEEDETWEEETDKLLMTVPIIGCSFKKNYRDPVKRHPVGEHVTAFDLVLNYWAKSVQDCERKTHRYYLYDREVRERQLLGVYTDVGLGRAQKEPDPGQEDLTGKDQRQGIADLSYDSKTPRLILEQHCYFDFDGDGYEEPYVVTVDYSSGKVLRIVNRFRKVKTEQQLKIEALTKRLKESQSATEVASLQGQIRKFQEQDPTIVKIDAVEYFTAYTFIPSPDGGVYGLGFGALLGPVNQAVDTLINELVDAGKLQNQSSGFIGRGARIQGGRMRFDFGEWKRVNVSGATLRESIVPLPVNQPSAVLFQLLGLLIDYGQRITSVTDVLQGQPVGQNTPAYTSQQMLQQGMAVFAGIFKRIYRAMREEFRKVYYLNRMYLDPMEYFQVLDGPDQQIYQKDYLGDPADIRPAADPNAILGEEKNRQSMFLAERSQMVPGYNGAAVELKLLEAQGISDVETLFPVDKQGQPVIKPPPPPEFQVKILEEQRRTLEGQVRGENDSKEADADMLVAQADVELKNAQTIKVYAEAGVIDKEVMLREAEVFIKRMAEQNKALKTMAEGVVKREANRIADRRLAQKPGNGGAAANPSGTA
jgi:hypothetical protein